MLVSKRLSLAGIAILCLVLAAQLSLSAKPQEPRAYPERGMVISTYGHRDGTVYVGSSAKKVTPGFRIETDTKVYEIESKKNYLTLGETIEFRIEKDWVYVKNGDKEEKFRLVGTEPKPPKVYNWMGGLGQ